MFTLYCLTNASFKENIVCVGITTCLSQVIHDINKSFLPTPYTVFLTKNVHRQTSIDTVWSLLRTFGKHLQDTFFEISLDVVQQLFDLISDESGWLTVVERQVEYAIPLAADMIEDTYAHVGPTSVALMLKDTELYYDRLSVAYQDGIDL